MTTNWNNAYLWYRCFCGSEIQPWVSWVLCSGPQKDAIELSVGLFSYLEAWMGENLLPSQFRLLSELIYSLLYEGLAVLLAVRWRLPSGWEDTFSCRGHIFLLEATHSFLPCDFLNMNSSSQLEETLTSVCQDRVFYNIKWSRNRNPIIFAFCWFE